MSAALPPPSGAACRCRSRASATAVPSSGSTTSSASWTGGCKAINSGCETFIVADDEQPSTPDFVALLGAALGRPARLVPMPPALLRGVLSATGRGAMAEGLLSSLAVDTSKAKSAGWRPRFTLAEGLARAFAPSGSPAHATEA